MTPITMQDVRLMAGEGKLSAQTVLDACNAVLRHREPHEPSRVGRLERENAALREVEPDDVECEAALAGEGIHVWGPDGDRFVRMFAAAMRIRNALAKEPRHVD